MRGAERGDLRKVAGLFADRRKTQWSDMRTFTEAAAKLEALEARYLAQLTVPNGALPALHGSARFYGLSGEHENTTERMPVVACVGINYTQHAWCRLTLPAIVHEPLGSKVGPSTSVAPLGAVIDELGNSTRAVNMLLDAYKHNHKTWMTKPGEDPRSPLRTYASADAGDVHGPFLLIMTNVTPFITWEYWQNQVEFTPDACSTLVNEGTSTQHLDALANELNVDLWIGHSAIGGTRWVWQRFAELVKQHNLRRWLLTCNISGKTHLHIRTFSLKKKDGSQHRLHPWYGMAQ